MKKKLFTFITVVLTVVMSMSGFYGCSKRKSISNESTRLVIGSQEFDGVFNPFYSSSTPDANVVSMTQISMLGSDKDGKVSYGANEACVVLDYEESTTGEGEAQTTTYKFVLKNDLKFSNGKPLTIKDVLFNLYEYIDPMYYGSSTLYSTDIVGLDAYRLNSEEADSQSAFNAIFEDRADVRYTALLEAIYLVYDDNKGTSVSDDKLASELAIKAQSNTAYQNAPDDYVAAKKLLKTFLEEVWTYSVGTAEDIEYTNEDTDEKLHLTTNTEAFLFNLGFIYWDDDEYKFEYSVGTPGVKWGDTVEQEKETCINQLYGELILKMNETINGYIAGNVFDYITAMEKQEYYDDLKESGKQITNVSGITFANRTQSVTVNGTVYGVPQYSSDADILDKRVTEGNEVLQIVIHKVDPKAIWNFGFVVAPMFYYSNAEQIKDFDYTDHFGVEYGSRTFQDETIKNSAKIGLPVGAGPYKATTRSGDSSNVTSATFKSNNVVYFERNENFMFDVKIKYVNYQVVTSKLMMQSLFKGDIHYVEPNCTQENITEIESHESDGFDKLRAQTNGYGYIGINAEKIPDINVRKAIMHSINTQLCVDYYGAYASAIYRPMSKANWAYPENCTAYYPYDSSGDASKALLSDYSLDNGVLSNGVNRLEYTFTIAGDSTDHPAYRALLKSAEILNKIGFKIEVKRDLNALKKLNNGDLTVWAAAWSSTIDPDMYQVYHMDSTAGAVNNWGYREILKAENRGENATGPLATEYKIVEQLSAKIDAARETTEESERKPLYSEALDLVMQLAVELPAYQRSDLFAFNAKIIDKTTFPEEITPFQSPLARIWEVSLKE